MNDHKLLEVKVWGEFACFTRPEMKVERVSYPMMTPSAARGILEAIFWKPEISWIVKEIWVLKPIQHFSILRNELSSKIAFSSAKKNLEVGGGYFIEDDRTQRHTLALRAVEYIIKADFKIISTQNNFPKYLDQFNRRVEKGQCFNAPYLGCREFTASFGKPDGTEKPIKHTDDLGRMLFDIAYEKGN
ncbi:type I-C CRISPR-associated protein Cas5c, partial [bacterium]|nr:type I-C CRISPR-associated protein Cas5c [bacterium]